MFAFCDRFKCLPDEVMRQDAQLIEDFFVIMEEQAKAEEKEEKRQRRQKRRT